MQQLEELKGQVEKLTMERDDLLSEQGRLKEVVSYPRTSIRVAASRVPTNRDHGNGPGYPLELSYVRLFKQICISIV